MKDSEKRAKGEGRIKKFNNFKGKKWDESETGWGNR